MAWQGEILTTRTEGKFFMRMTDTVTTGKGQSCMWSCKDSLSSDKDLRATPICAYRLKLHYLTYLLKENPSLM